VPACDPDGAASPGFSGAAPPGGLDLLTLYEAHRERILRYCLSFLKNPEDAEDAAQETFTRAAPQVARLEGDATAYLTTVARNVCYDVVRHRSRKGTRDLDSVEVIDDGVGPERRAVASELAKQMWGHLNTDERTFLAHSFAGFRYEEIAALTGRSVPAVSVSICRARQRLRQLSGALGAAATLPVLVGRALDRLWKRGAEAAGNTASAMGALDPSMVAAVILGAVGTVANAVNGGSQPAPHVSAVNVATPALSPFTLPDRAASIATRAPLAVAAESGATPAPTSAPNGASPTPAVLAPGLPGTNASPQDVQFTSISASPNYERDHTAYAVGSDMRTCPSGQVCPVLFSTRDGGSSWMQRAALGFTGGAVMVPSGFPRDPTVFVAGPQGLLASTDGGDHFSPISQVTGPSAVAPGSAPGLAHVAVVQGTVWMYQQATGRLAAGPALPAGIVAESAMFASPDVLLIVGQQYQVLPAPHRVPVIVRCNSNACASTTAFEDPDVRLATGPPGSPLLAYSSKRVYRSTDLGTSFTSILDAGADSITAVATASLFAGQLRTVVAELSAAGAPRLVIGDPSTGAWSTLPTALLDGGVTAIAPFGDGRIASAVTLGPQGGYGLRCLAELASSWRPAC
jgi:RNA polymerase sigma-70 factor (ECF subfamily)